MGNHNQYVIQMQTSVLEKISKKSQLFTNVWTCCELITKLYKTFCKTVTFGQRNCVLAYTVPKYCANNSFLYQNSYYSAWGSLFYRSPRGLWFWAWTWSFLWYPLYILYLKKKRLKIGIFDWKSYIMISYTYRSVCVPIIID